MAQKRMFDKTITNSDDFIDMPDSSQNLYFHLSMNADDDGFVNNWKSILRMTGHKEDDLKVLIAKSFIIPFESGVIVIKHWRINNYLRKDRYTETNYKEEKQKLILDNNLVYQLDTSGQPRKDKIRLDNNIYAQKQTQNNTENKSIFEQRFDTFWEAYPRKVGKSNVKKWFLKNKPSEELLEKMLSKIKEYKTIWKEPQYIPYPATWLNAGSWEDEINNKTTNTKSDNKTTVAYRPWYEVPELIEEMEQYDGS